MEVALQGDSPGRDWLLKKRSSVGPRGWQNCFDEQVRCETIDADHFSFFRELHVSMALMDVSFSSPFP